MFSKLCSLSLVIALWFGFMTLVSASPVPIVPRDEVALLKGVIGREPIAVDVNKHDYVFVPEDAYSEEVAKRDPDLSLNSDEDVDVEARICRFSCA